MQARWISVVGAGLLSLATAASAERLSNADLARQVADTERAFAATMKNRDHAAFTGFLADEAIFFNSDQAVLRGKDAVAKGWKPMYDAPEAPFSWEPDHVEVLDSGTLAHSSGPVYDRKGRITARFNSIWRQEAPGKWRIVYDKGTPVCDCKKDKLTP